MAPLPSRHKNLARGLALVADALQFGLVPLFGEGIASPVNVAIDVVLFGVLWRLIGFHFALLPAFVAENVPLLNIAPTWTLAVLLATRKSANEPDSLPASIEAPSAQNVPVGRPALESSRNT